MLAILWAVLVGGFVVLVLASYRGEISCVSERGNLYGVLLDRGELQLFRGERHGGPTPQSVARWIPWNGVDATNQPEFVTPHFTQTLATMHSPVPFWPVRRGYTWSRQAADGTRTYVDFGRDIRAISGPAWLIVLLATTVYWPALYKRLKRGPAPGACTVCGYDLRATPNRCPECGHVRLANEPVP